RDSARAPGTSPRLPPLCARPSPGPSPADARCRRTGSARASCAWRESRGTADDCAQFDQATLVVHALRQILLQEVLHVRPQGDRRVDAWIAALVVRADRDQIAILLIRAERLLEAPRQRELLLLDDVVHHSTDRGFDVDRRIVAGLRYT